MKYFSGIFAVVLVLVGLFAATLLQSANSLDQTKYQIRIPAGASTYTVKKILEEAGIVKPDSSFAFAAKVLRVSKGIQAGQYELSPSETLLSILWKLKRGQIVETGQNRVKVTFPEGTSIYKMGEILRKNKVSDPDKFRGLVKEGITAPLREKHWTIFKYLPSESLEGFLYPDTYWFYDDDKVEDLVEKMVSRFEQVILPFWEKAHQDTQLTLFETLTLASIIEKEAQKPEERKIISSVYHNRLRKNMYLAACPTIKYALDDPTKRVTADQLEVKSPYNTYKHKGLPPGPICNPGIESIKAAVYPAKTNYYYFVAKDNGSHIFSATWAQHQRARVKAGIN